MKPVVKNQLSSTIYGVKMYIDDIELLLSKISATGYHYQISDEERIYENIEELKTHKGNNPDAIEILLKSGFDLLLIRIADNVSSIVSIGDTYKNVFYETEVVFLKKKRSLFRVYFFNTKNALFSIILLVLVLSASHVYSTHYLNETVNAVPYIGFIAFWFVVLIVTLINPNYNGKIELNRRHENSFFKNNKDSLFIAIISSLMGPIITYLFAVF